MGGFCFAYLFASFLDFFFSENTPGNPADTQVQVVQSLLMLVYNAQKVGQSFLFNSRCSAGSRPSPRRNYALSW